MVLDRYFTAKACLKATLPALRALRGRIKGGADGAAASCINAVEGLREVFRVAVVGTPAGEIAPLIEVVKSEAGGRLVLDELEVPKEETVTPHRDLLEQYHAVICTLDALDPWAPIMWNYLGTFPMELRSRLLLILQNCDMRTGAELEPVVVHMNDEIQKRLGQRRSIVRFSARLALRSRADCANPDGLRRRSGVEELCDALDAVLAESTQCFKTIGLATVTAQEMIDALRVEIGEVAAAVEETDSVCKGIEHLAENLLAQTSTRLNPVLTMIDRGIMDVIVAAEDQLVTNQSNLKAGEQALALQNQIKDGVARAAKRSLKEAAERMEAHLEASWDHISHRLRDQLGDAFRPKDLKEVAWQKQRKPFLEAGQIRLQREQDSVSLEEGVAAELARPAKARRYLVASVILVVLGVVGGGVASGQWVISSACLAVLLIPVFLYIRWMKRWRKSVASTLWEALDSHRERIEQAMGAVLKEDTEVYANEFRRRVTLLATRAEWVRSKKEPALSDFDELEKAVVEVQALLEGNL